MFPSSSYDANRFMNDEAATTSAVETSYTMLVYGRERGIERAGRWASKSTPGIHSTRLGPWPHARHEVSISASELVAPGALPRRHLHLQLRTYLV